MSKIISVVLPIYNAQDCVTRAIRSVRSNPEDSLIVAVDDGSTDNTLEVLNNFGSDIILKTGPNRGACYARNCGLNVLAGLDVDYILFLDADDEVDSDLFESVLSVIKSESPDIILSKLHRVKDNTVVLTQDLEGQDIAPEHLFETWLTGPQLNPAAVIWKRTFLEKIGGWNEEVLINQDGELMMRAFLHHPHIAWNNRGAGIYHVDAGPSLSSTKSQPKLDNYVQTLSGLLDQAAHTDFANRCGGIEQTLYKVARMAFRRGWPETGRKAQNVLRARGFKKHYGSWPHRIAANVLGLELKVRLWKS